MIFSLLFSLLACRPVVTVIDYVCLCVCLCTAISPNPNLTNHETNETESFAILFKVLLRGCGGENDDL